ncbi:MAG: hypothetical protein AVDCRST_MAG10-569 [uncultured Acidimicrobiales bacterium]|uniref:FAD-binding domain-containing protein n=1 Tax=uncultured Acidimicrobiales bacterium TaxID=310071 RepID=A0A6J4HAV6_9ACTN|nr:MAG: hypothetical protein AVDCRST_MAG10-569 [uncultured Acidimicrobiales bacterium]
MADSRGPDVVIAGGGIAAAATAIRLRALGLSVGLVVRELPPLPGIEAIPLRALELFDVLGEPDVAEEAGAVEVEGPAHEWHGAAGRVPARFVHVDRVALAAQLLSRAELRGATVQRTPRLPRPEDVPATTVALVDGTGRAAAWSRPVQTQGSAVAWQFRAPPADEVAGRIVRGDGWWAYRLGHAGASWVGVVTAAGTLAPSVLESAAGRLGVPPESMVAQGRRPAWVQHAAQPVSGRRIAVGDAALAHDPIAGQGIRFALGSAIAAAATVATWAGDPSRREIATGYYRNLVEAEAVRHRTALDELANPYQQAPSRPEPPTEPAVVRFRADVVQTELSVDGRIEVGPAVRVRDGRTVRWVGAYDLLDLARLAADPTPRMLVVAGLLEAGLDVATARALVSWALGNGVLIDAAESGDSW